MSIMFEGIDVPIRAIDQATDVFRKVSSEAQRSMSQVEASVRTVEEAHEKLTVNFRQVVTGFSGVATSAFNLYNAYDRVQDMTVSVNRANLQVQSTLNSLEDAQRRYNATVEKYGAESEQAVAAAKDLALAQERYQVAVERAQMMQGNLNEVMVQSAISVIPTVITMVDNLNRIRSSHVFTIAAEKLGITGLTAAEIAHTVAAKASAAAQAVLNAVMNANPVLLVVTALGALTAALIYAYETCEPFRNAVDGLGATLMSVLQPAVDAVVGALTWLWNNVLVPLGEAFRTVWNIVTDNPILSALFGPLTAITYLFKHWENVTKALGDALKWFIDNIVSPLSGLLKPLTDGFGALTNWFSNLGNAASTSQGMIDSYTQSMIDLYQTVGQPPSTGLIESFEYLDKTIRNIEMPEFGEVSVPVAYNIPSFPEIEAPTASAATLESLSLTPSTVVPSTVRLEINAPLVNVEGSADRETAELAARLVEQKLRNVLVEASSSNAPETHRRIRSGGLINVA